MSHNNHHPGPNTTAPVPDPSTSHRNLTEPGPAATATLTHTNNNSNNNQPPNNGATNSSPLHETYPCPYTSICGQLEAFSSGDALLEHIRVTHLTRRESDASGEPAAAAAAAQAAAGGEQDAFRQEELSEFSSLNSTSPGVSYLRDPVKKFPCPFQGCYKSFAQASGLRCHYRTHSGERPFVCTWEGCDKSYTTNNRLKIHFRTHTNEAPYACEYPGCTYRSKQKCSLKPHMQKHYRQSLRSRSGTSVSSNMNSLESNLLPSLDTISPINENPRASSYFSNVLGSMIHEEPTNSHPQDTSQEMELDDNDQEKVKSEDSRRNPESEQDSESESSSSQELSNDDAAVEDGVSPSEQSAWLIRRPSAMSSTQDAGSSTTKIGMLDILSSVALSAQAIERQIESNPHKKFTCQYVGCIKSFGTSAGLKQHQKTHTGEKPFVCNFEGCGKAYTTNNRLKIHIRGHSNENPYACDFPGCTYRTKQKCSLKPHQIIHLPPEVKSEIRAKEERTIPCKFCGHKYKTQISLDQHCWREHRVSHNL
ncbi:hypothetical protein BJ741DRAFT_617411 [Chytriomyces cf. hyalinus JEL632]|nr:hypothetical protein BJ741DRAFT_617411 [Chytriomyces cf. hyalinus JEL632]